MVRSWTKEEASLYNRQIKLSAKRKTMVHYTPKYPEMDPGLLEWFSHQRSLGEYHVTRLKDKTKFLFTPK